MKKIILSLIVIYYSAINIYAQDLIVTEKRDSLNCRITEVDFDMIYFILKSGPEIKDTSLHSNEVLYYKKGFYKIAKVPPEKIDSVKDFKVGVKVGWSYITQSVKDVVPNETNEYKKGLKTGYHFGIDAAYFGSQYLGIGLKYLLFNTRHEGNISKLDTTGMPVIGSLIEDITIQYIGPEFFTRVHSKSKKRLFMANLTFAYLAYKDKVSAFEKFSITGNSVAMIIDAGVEFKLDNHIAMGFGASYAMGFLTEVKKTTNTSSEKIKFEDDDSMNLSRLDLSVGLSITF